MDESRRGDHLCGQRAGRPRDAGADRRKELQHRSSHRRHPRGTARPPYDLVAVAGGWKHLTRPAYADAIRRAVGGSERAVDLTQSEVLVLMCIAYFQPITRAELSTFFGREISRDLIGNLRSHDFIASGPRAPQPGAPYTYVTTQAFLLEFGLDTLRDLPDREALEDAGLLSKEKLLAGDIMPGFAGNEERDGLLETDK